MEEKKECFKCGKETTTYEVFKSSSNSDLLGTIVICDVCWNTAVSQDYKGIDGGIKK